MNEETFAKQKQEAINRMKNMTQKADSQAQKPKPLPQNPTPPKPKSSPFFEGLNIPFLDKLKNDGDITLILGILLLLLNEKADKKLLFALIYILL